MRVLVTGGAGFIGSQIVEQFQGRAEVRVIDNLRSGRIENLANFRCDFIKGSILDRSLVRQAMEGVDYVFHLAAMISVPESMQKPIECAEINTLGTLVVIEEATRDRVRKFVFSSSAAIYGDNPAVPKAETMSPEPKSPYAITKLDGEYYCQMFAAEQRLRTACLRYFNVFGPRQDPKSQYAAAVTIFLERALRDEPITIFGDGEQTRDFIYVKDVAAANIHFATIAELGGVFNVAYGSRISINDLARTIVELAGSRAGITYREPRPGDVKHSLASTDKLRSTGFVPSGSLPKGLREAIESCRNGVQFNNKSF